MNYGEAYASGEIRDRSIPLNADTDEGGRHETADHDAFDAEFCDAFVNANLAETADIREPAGFYRTARKSCVLTGGLTVFRCRLHGGG